MATQQRTEVDQITLDLINGIVLWRETTVLEENGVELLRTYHRVSREADDDFNPVPPEVAPHRALVVTPDKKAKARARREANAPRFAPGRPV